MFKIKWINKYESTKNYYYLQRSIFMEKAEMEHEAGFATRSLLCGTGPLKVVFLGYNCQIGPCCVWERYKVWPNEK